MRAVAVAAPAGVDVETYTDVSVLPHFDPDLDLEPLPPGTQLTDKPVAWVKAPIADAVTTLLRAT